MRLDPLTLVTLAVSLALLFLIIPPSLRGNPVDTEALVPLATIFGGLLVAISTRKKDGDSNGK